MIAPGHTGPETGTAAEGTLTAILGTLRKQLGAFDMDREVSLVFAVGDLPPQSKDFERVIAVDLDRESADDETAIELELGPNNCAAG